MFSPRVPGSIIPWKSCGVMPQDFHTERFSPVTSLISF
jgi:hypothetical protein